MENSEVNRLCFCCIAIGTGLDKHCDEQSELVGPIEVESERIDLELQKKSVRRLFFKTL